MHMIKLLKGEKAFCLPQDILKTKGLLLQSKADSTEREKVIYTVTCSRQ